MDNKKSEVEKALEDIFNEPFLTLSEEKEQKEKEEIEKNMLSDSNDEPLNSAFEYHDDSSIEKENIVNESKEEVKEEKQVQFTNPYVVEEKKTNKYNIYILLLLALLFTLLTIFIITITNTEKVVVCSLKIKDDGYQLTDDYIIAHKSGNLTYIQGEYEYTAYNDEYKEQLQSIKEEKLPVIINSNGMKGFTHVLESADSYIKIYSYYDITKIDFKTVDKTDSKLVPLSYIGLNSKTTYKSLTQNLKTAGYVCKKTK